MQGVTRCYTVSHAGIGFHRILQVLADYNLIVLLTETLNEEVVSRMPRKVFNGATFSQTQ